MLYCITGEKKFIKKHKKTPKIEIFRGYQTKQNVRVPKIK
jgi:hypothetical protein